MMLVQQETPKVSIGMPVYNGGAFLRDALDSLMKQSYSGFELIISDNASNDETEAICREYASKDKRIRYIRQPINCGAIANFRYVLNEAMGEYFMWAAHDDLWDCNYIEELMFTLKKHNCCALAYGKTSLIDSKNKVTKYVKNNFFELKWMKIHQHNPRIWNTLIHFLDRNPFKIYGLYKREAAANTPFNSFLGTAQYSDHLFLLHFLSSHLAIECLSAKHYYRLIPKTPREYANDDSFNPPTRLRVDFQFAKELWAIFLRKYCVLAYLCLPALVCLFFAAYGKAWVKSAISPIVNLASRIRDGR